MTNVFLPCAPQGFLGLVLGTDGLHETQGFVWLRDKNGAKKAIATQIRSSGSTLVRQVLPFPPVANRAFGDGILRR
jgi:hypothetical protein